MHITEIRATPINIPLDLAYFWSVGVNRGFSKTVIQVFTDDGIVGLGETPAAGHAHLIDEALAPLLIGMDPFDLAACERRCLTEWRSARNIGNDTLTRAFGGIEIALWDIKAKRAGVPLSRLLGGAVREEVAFSEYFSYRLSAGDHVGERSVEELIEYCLHQKEEYGSTIFEGKVGYLDARTDVQMVTAVREALGDDAVLRLDANYGWSLSTARAVVRALEPLGIANIEDPVIGYEDMARLRQHTAIPFSTHELDLPHAVAVGGPDAFVANVAVLGGIGPTIRFAQACDVMGRDFWFYSGDGGIMTAAYLHLSAALPVIRHPHQSLLRWQTMDVIVGGVPQPRNNVLPVPSGPGLGVDIDPERLEEAHAHYNTHGPCEAIALPVSGAHFRLPRY